MRPDLPLSETRECTKDVTISVKAKSLFANYCILFYICFTQCPNSLQSEFFQIKSFNMRFCRHSVLKPNFLKVGPQDPLGAVHRVQEVSDKNVYHLNPL